MSAGRFTGLSAGLLALGFATSDCGAAGPAATEVPQWSLGRDVVIGGVDGPSSALTRVGTVLVDAAHIYILQPQDGNVIVFDRRGRFARTFGGRGAGPGEFIAPLLMGWYGYELWVSDWNARRITFFDVDKGSVRTIPYVQPFPAGYDVFNWGPWAVLGDGRIVGYPEVGSHAIARGLTPFLVLPVSDAGGAVQDTLAVLSREGEIAEITAGLRPNAISFLSTPLPQGDLIDLTPDGAEAVVVNRRSWNGSGTPEFRVTRFSASGDTVFDQSIAYRPRSVPEDFFDDRIQNMQASNSVVDRAAHARAVRQFFETRRYFPPVTRLLAGGDGTTWLGQADDGSGEAEWLVLDASGASIGRVRLPTTSRVSAANRTEVWVVEQDALDIPYVVRYEIVP